MHNAIVTTIGLRHGEAGAAAMLDGWGEPEHNGTWSLGRTSRIMLGPLDPAHRHVVALSTDPFVNRPFVRHQTIRAMLGDTTLGEADIGGAEFIGFSIPPALVNDGEPVVLTLHHPRAARPCDSFVTNDARWLGVSYSWIRVFRLADVPSWTEANPTLPFGASPQGAPSGEMAKPDAALADAIEARLGLSLRQLMLRFDSLGDNCEVGLVQRRCGAEPLGLFRFAAVQLRQLLHGLDRDLDGLGAPEAIEPELHGERTPREYMIRERTYQLVYHAFRYENEIGSEAIRDQEAGKLRFLRDKFLADLQVGAKILVCKRKTPLTEAQVLPLFAELGRRGPNTLLWVAEADAAHPPASVEVLGPRLLKGYVDRFAPPEHVPDLSLDCWMRLFANAYTVWPERHLSET